MNKIFLYIVLVIFFNISLFSKEPTLAILRSINSNDYQRFSIGMYEFICRPYGVVTLDEIYKLSDQDSGCKQAIEKFYIKNPVDKYFSKYLLKLRQTYHIEFKDNRCVVYAKGKMSYSEILLRKGIAVVKPKFKDKEFKDSFKQSQKYAEDNKNGIYKDETFEKCRSELNQI